MPMMYPGGNMFLRSDAFLIRHGKDHLLISEHNYAITQGSDQLHFHWLL